VGQLAGVGDAIEVAAQESDAGGLDGDVGAGAHGEADVRGGEGGGVVDTVAGEGDDAISAAELVDDVCLVVGQYLCLDPVDAEVGRHGGGGDPVVAGEHDDLDAFLAERGEGGRGGVLDLVGDADDAGGGAVDGDEDGGRAGATQRSAFSASTSAFTSWDVRNPVVPMRTR
jgi:hypothetical protein